MHPYRNNTSKPLSPSFSKEDLVIPKNRYIFALKYLNIEMRQLIAERIGQEQLTQCAEMLRVIAHPTRMEIIRLLYEHGPLSVSFIQEKLNEAQPLISNHLKNLKDKGLLEAERSGTTISYKLRYPQVIKVLDAVEECSSKL